MKTIKAKVHRLPTEDSSCLHHIPKMNMFTMTTNPARKDIIAGDEYVEQQHLYITTDEEINEGDWFYYNHNGGVIGQYKKGMGEIDGKIIATTDPKLIIKTTRLEKITNPGVYEKQLPQIPQSFIEEFCKAGGIDEVLVEVENYEILKARRLGVNSHLDAINSINSSIFPQPKLNPDNTIIIHPVKEKMYTLKQIKHMFDIGRDSAFQEMHFDEAIKYRDNELNKMD